MTKFYLCGIFYLVSFLMEGLQMENITYHEQVLAFAIDFGKKLLESGYEVKKTQDTMVFLCKNFNAKEVEFFVIPSQINSTIKFEDGNYICQMREIVTSSINLFLIEKLNALSRYICSHDVTLEEARKMFEDTINTRPYNKIFNSIGAGLGAGGFAIFFGGSALDGICAFLIAFMAFYLNGLVSKKVSKISAALLMSFFDGLVALLIFKTTNLINLDVVMIGSIMTIIPGMAFGNGVKDLLIGQTISGLLTLVNALLIAIAIASGIALSASLFIKDYTIGVDFNASNIIVVIFSSVGTLGFGLLFSLEPKKLPIVSIGGLITALILVLAKNIMPEDSIYFTLYANTMASAVALLMSEVLARVLKAPTSIFLLPMLIPLVPGGNLYRTMTSLVANNTEKFHYYLNATIFTGVGIAIGLVLFGMVFQIILYALKLTKNIEKFKKTK